MKKVLTLGIVVCLLLGVFVLSGFANDKQTIDHFDPSHVYETNENGQTYGSAFYAPSPDKEPDLILAESLDGTQGYVYSADLNADLPSSPDELIASMEKYREIWDNAPAGEVVIAHYIPLYAVDGKTVIGEFPITIGFKESEKSEYPGSLVLK